MSASQSQTRHGKAVSDRVFYRGPSDAEPLPAAVWHPASPAMYDMLMSGEITPESLAAVRASTDLDHVPRVLDEAVQEEIFTEHRRAMLKEVARDQGAVGVDMLRHLGRIGRSLAAEVEDEQRKAAEKSRSKKRRNK